MCNICRMFVSDGAKRRKNQQREGYMASVLALGRKKHPTERTGSETSRSVSSSKRTALRLTSKDVEAKNKLLLADLK